VEVISEIVLIIVTGMEFATQIILVLATTAILEMIVVL
jgi:hypothetical protein